MTQSVSMRTLLEAAAEVAGLAGEAALRHYRSGIEVETKADGSPVTLADREAERVARAWLEERFPADGILGEELGEVRPQAFRRWVIDPIDGTQSFVRGVPLWGTLVAALEDDKVVAGAAAFPALGEHLAAARGEGCLWNGAPCSVSKTDALARATVLTTDLRFKDPARWAAWQSLSGGAAIARTWGDCYGYALVATGRAEVMVDATLAAWDAAPVAILVEEAGGVFTDWKARRTALGGDAIATNAALAERVRAMLVRRGA
jgi:histidinol phosphatase-like enzyme (inositol monophosphatase family)